jgi:thiol-disulfide isomerase/thioredoxin
MTLHELESAQAVHKFKETNANTLICFSATWCGPCKASKPTLEALAGSYAADPSLDIQCGIVYEHNLSEAIHEFQVKAFPTYVLYVGNGSKEFGRISGVNFDGIREMITKAGCQKDLGQGNTIGGADVRVLSAEEARAHRLALFDKKSPVASSSSGRSKNDEPMKTDEIVIDADANMQTDTDQTKPAAAGDAEMTDASQPEPEVELIDPTENLSKDDLTTLTESMGFALIRAQKGLMNSTTGLEGAIEWLMNHQDDADIDDPIPKVPKAGAVATSYKCNECGKILPNMAALELHANKTGHSDFEESTQQVKPLTEEEKAKKIEQIKTLLKLKRVEREELEKVEDVDREKQRRNDGKKSGKTKEEMEKQARKRETFLRKKEKEDFKRERARIKAEIEKDKLERRANKGKMTSKLGIDGYHPDAIQYDAKSENAASASGGQQQGAPKKRKGSVAKIDEYITKISSYKAGGDGGKCLKILVAYLKNIVANPLEEKFKKINMENKVYKTKVKPFIGAKVLLMAVGFAPDDSKTAMVLDEDADMDVLAQTKEKLEKAFAAY